MPIVFHSAFENHLAALIFWYLRFNIGYGRNLYIQILCTNILIFLYTGNNNEFTSNRNVL